MRIALVNSWMLNGGDAGIIYGTIDALKRICPDAEITVFAHLATEAGAYYKDLSVQPMAQDSWGGNKFFSLFWKKTFCFRSFFGIFSRQEMRFFQSVQKNDLIIYCGGGYLNDLYSTKNLFCIIRKTLSSGKPHIAYAHSFGPFFKKNTLKSAVEVLGEFALVICRDRDGYRLLEASGLKSEILRLTADAAFAMDVLPDEGISLEDKCVLNDILKFKGGDRLLVVSVREWNFPGEANAASLKEIYKSELRKIVQFVSKKQTWKVCFLSTCQGRGAYHYDDSKFSRELTDEMVGLDRSKIYFCNRPFHPRMYPVLIAKIADLVLSMRMHFVIYSIMGEVPYIGLAYEKKLSELSRQIGFGDFCHDLIGLRSENVIRSFLELQRGYQDFKKRIQTERILLCQHAQLNASMTISIKNSFS